MGGVEAGRAGWARAWPVPPSATQTLSGYLPAWVLAPAGPGDTGQGCQASVRTRQGSALWAADADLACWAQEVHPRGELGAIGRV